MVRVHVEIEIAAEIGNKDGGIGRAFPRVEQCVVACACMMRYIVVVVGEGAWWAVRLLAAGAVLEGMLCKGTFEVKAEKIATALALSALPPSPPQPLGQFQLCLEERVWIVDMRKPLVVGRANASNIVILDKSIRSVGAQFFLHQRPPFARTSSCRPPT
jgi:hypothetical protein